MQIDDERIAQKVVEVFSAMHLEDPNASKDYVDGFRNGYCHGVAKALAFVNFVKDLPEGGEK
jgi:hypothetical protein